jgi:hypothetical protein
MTFLEHKKHYANDYDNMYYKWHNTTARLYFREIDKYYNELNIKLKIKKIDSEDIKIMHEKIVEIIERIYLEANIEIILKEIDRLYDFIKNNTESSFFNNKNHVKYELENVIKNILDTKHIFFEDGDIYNKALHLFTILEIINGYYETFVGFVDLIDEILLDMYPDFNKNYEKYMQ